MNVERMLNDEIESELEELKKLEVGTDKHKAAIDGITKLLDRAIEMDRFDNELNEKVESRDADVQLREKQLLDEKRDRWVKNGINVAGIAVSTALAVWGTLITLKFEETGIITTTAGKSFINRLFPKK